MLFINDIVQNINAGVEKIFTVDDMQLFLMLYADDAVVFAKSLKHYNQFYTTSNHIVHFGT